MLKVHGVAGRRGRKEGKHAKKKESMGSLLHHWVTDLLIVFENSNERKFNNGITQSPMNHTASFIKFPDLIRLKGHLKNGKLIHASIQIPNRKDRVFTMR